MRLVLKGGKGEGVGVGGRLSVGEGGGRVEGPRLELCLR